MFDSILGIGVGIAFILAIFLVATADTSKNTIKRHEDKID